jgi:anaerobic magnesium-protoporphyrin IX monomethyl ester cyclase
MAMIDVLLVNPPPLRRSGPPKEHLGLGYLAAGLRRAGFSVRIIDAAVFELDLKALNVELQQTEFRVLGVSVLFQDSLKFVLDWLRELRNGGLKAHVSIGGQPATFTYKYILESYDCVDSIVRGEGDITFIELVEQIIGGGDWRGISGIVHKHGGEIATNAPRPLVDDLDSLPWPERDIYAAKPRAFEQVTAIGSRGCYEYCAFCSIATFYRSFKGRVWRRRDPNDVLDEIDFVRSLSPSPFVTLFDDSFIGPGKIGRRQAHEFAEELGRRKPDYSLGISCRADQVEEELFRELKLAGLRLVFLGIESGNNETLDLFNKRTTEEVNRRALEILKKLDLSVEIGFIMFNPYATFDQVRTDLEFLLETGIGPDIRNLNNLGFFPGQPIMARVESDGLLRGTPFGYEAKFADERVGALFKTLKETVFADFRPPPDLMAAHQLVQSAQVGFEVPPIEALIRARGLIARYHEAVYDTMQTAVSMFEKKCGGPVAVDDLKRDFAGRLSSPSELGDKHSVGPVNMGP